MQKKPTLLVMAAGMGSRYGGLKQIDKLGPNGETIIDYSIYDALQSGFGKVVFVIRKSIEADFKEVIFNKYKGHAEVDYVLQELEDLPGGFTCPADRIKPWGTTQAVLMTKDKIDTFFTVINGDDFYGRHAFKAMADYLNTLSLEKDTNTYSMVAYQLDHTLSDNGSVSRGVCHQNEEGYLTEVLEYTKIQKTNGVISNTFEDGSSIALEPNTLVSMNFWGFHPSIFAHLDRIFKEFLTTNLNVPKSECYIPKVVDQLIKEGNAKVKVLKTDAEWFGITYQEDRLGVVNAFRKLYSEKIYPEQLW